MSITYLLGDTREMVATIPDGSVSLVACSPPFIALRSYLPADHPMKHAEIGSEPDPATFIDTLLALTAEWGRVLAPWGSIAIELGDTYAGSGGAGGDYNEGGLRDGQNAFVGSSSAERRTTDTKRTRIQGEGHAQPIRDLHGKVQGGGANWPRPKCLALVPQAYALSLAYGRNVLNGNPSPAGQWLVRNMIVWHRPNPAVGALGDKFRPSTSYITVATRSPKRWFDLTAVRDEPSPNTHARLAKGIDVAERTTKSAGRGNFATMPELATSAGAPPLDAWFDACDGHDMWTMTTQPSSLAHYAMWPAKLAERLVLSMCPAEVCGECGEPRRRVEQATGLVDQRGRQVERINWESGMSAEKDGGGQLGAMSLKKTGGTTTTTTTLGWTDCGHDAYRPGVVLDPFGGTGTTNAVAELHGRDSIWVDIDEQNRALVPQRMAEVSRSLFGTKPELPGQGDLFGGDAA